MGKPVNKTLRIAAMSAGEEIGHVSGPIATVGGNGDPLRSLLVGIDPVQEGTGDPSPDNVRPISGWSAVNVWRTGKNLLDVTSISTVKSTAANTRNGYYFSTPGTYTVKANASPGRSAHLSVRVKSGDTYGSATTIVQNGAATATATYAIVDGDTLIVFDAVDNPLNTSEEIFEAANVQLELGSTPTEYEPYSGNQYTIQLGQTVYGETLDALAGKMVIDRAMVDLGTLNWTKNATGQFFSTLSDDTNAADDKLGENLLCSCYKGGNAYTGNVNYTICIRVGTNKRIWAKDDRYSTGTELQTALAGEKLVYELATPIEIPITPTQISALRGQTVLWADSGDVDVEYVAVGGEGGKLALLLRNRKELLIALRKGLTPAEAGLLSSTLGGFVRPGLSTDDDKEEDEFI